MRDMHGNRRTTDWTARPIAQVQRGALIERIGIDLAERFSVSRKENRHILTVADYFGKLCKTYPLRWILLKWQNSLLKTEFHSMVSH